MATLVGYQAFLTSTVGINAFYLPANSPVIAMSYNVATDIVNLDLASISTNIYDLCVYNLATDTLINYAQDQPGQSYFQDLRALFKINSFVPGVISSSSDEGTSQSLLNPEFMSNFTLSNLQHLKTPYGRNYLQLAQSYGSLWGAS